MTPRRILFWIHLIAGSVAGLVILLMSVTGFLLAYERQINDRAVRDFHSTPAVAGQARLPMDSLLSTVQAGQPTAITVRSDPSAPVQFSYGRDRILLINAYSGAVLGEASPKLHAFFGKVEDLHRFLGTSAEKRPVGRAITGACNLMFLLLVCSGPIIWWPKAWTWTNLSKIVAFRGGLSGRARDWNWHNVIGIWCFTPLLLVVLTGVVMSYPWANNLLYRMTGNEPPPPPNQNAGPRPGGEGRRHKREGKEDQEGEPKLALEAAFARAQRQVPRWQTVNLRLPNSPAAPLVFSIDTGNGGRPDKRAQLTLDARSGEVVKWEPFSSYNLGRRLRTWGRFTHTGEAAGIFGQTIAATASAGAAVLVWTGLALALRRLNAWRKRLRPQVLERV
jgi:uncharacterized iron-regulated membrane protein